MEWRVCRLSSAAGHGLGSRFRLSLMMRKSSTEMCVNVGAPVQSPEA